MKLSCATTERDLESSAAGAIPEERDRRLPRSRATPTRSRREIRSERRILSFNPFKSVAIRVCRRIKGEGSRFQTTRNGLQGTRLLKEREKEEEKNRATRNRVKRRTVYLDGFEGHFHEAERRIDKATQRVILLP